MNKLPLLMIINISKFVHDYLLEKLIGVVIIYCENDHFGTFFINNRSIFTELWYSSNKLFIKKLYIKMKELEDIIQKPINFYYCLNPEQLEKKYNYTFNYNTLLETFK